MLTILNKRVDADMSDKEALILLMKRHLAATVEISIDCDDGTKTDLLAGMILGVSSDPETLIVETGNFLKLNKEKIQGIRNGSVIGFTSELLEAKKDLAIIDQLMTNLCKIRDIVYPHEVNYIYVKLETGGFDGYNRQIQALGETVYPVIRITMRVNDNEPLDVLINPEGATINPSTMTYLQELGIYQQALSSKFSLLDAETMVTEYLNKHNVRKDDISLNKRNCLVICNVKYVKAFLSVNFPTLMGRVSGRVVDVNEISAIYELTGLHDLNPRPRFYSMQPERYLEVLASTVKRLIKR